MKQRQTLLTEIPRWKFPPDQSPLPDKAWESHHFMVMLYPEPSQYAETSLRLSVVLKTQYTSKGADEHIRWDELQALKKSAGYGNWFAVEVYPKETDIIRDRNMRHLWLFSEQLKIGWVNE